MESHQLPEYLIAFLNEAIQLGLLIYIAFMVTLRRNRDTDQFAGHQVQEEDVYTPPPPSKPVVKRAPIYIDDATAAFIENSNRRNIPPSD